MFVGAHRWTVIAEPHVRCLVGKPESHETGMNRRAYAQKTREIVDVASDAPLVVVWASSPIKRDQQRLLPHIRSAEEVEKTSIVLLVTMKMVNFPFSRQLSFDLLSYQLLLKSRDPDVTANARRGDSPVIATKKIQNALRNSRLTLSSS